MLLHIKIDNFKGISKEINIACIASNKIRHSNNDISTISEKAKALKNICIIGSNASGKTSILEAIQSVKNFLMFPYRKSIPGNNKFNDYIQDMSPEDIKQLILNINKLYLGEQNNLRENEKTTIQLEIYIPKRERNICGIYTYTLMYDNNYEKNGVILEQLEFRKNYDNKKNKIIFSGNNIIESEISTAVLYQNNKSQTSIHNTERNIQYFKSFLDEIMDHSYYLNGSEMADLNNAMHNYKDKFKKLCNIADDKIINVTIDKNSQEQVIKFWNSKKSYLTFSQLSNGTKKIIVIGSIILEALENNKLLLIDEIEISLHPTLVDFLIRLNNVNDSNHYSQIIFTTHSPFIAFSMKNDQLYYIDNANNDLLVSNICDAINNGIISKDKSPERAWMDNLLIKNPDSKKIKEFINQ